MRFSRLLFFFAFALSTLSLGAQDTHFTLHNYAPLWLNPANTGSFLGSIRAGGVYRGQWYSLNATNTPTAYADAPLAFGFRKQDWVGVGFSLVADNAGEFNISSTFFGFSGAYHLSLDKKRTNILTLGAQYGSTSYGIKAGERIPGQQLNFGTDINGLGQVGQSEIMQSAQGPGSNDDRANYNDLNVGLKLKLLLDKKTGNVFEAGVSMLHLNNAKRTSLVQRQVPIDTMPGVPNPPDVGQESRRRKGTLHAHARLDMEMSEKWRFQPTLFFQRSAGTSSLSIQTWGSRNLKRNLDMRLGLGYRTGDAAKVMLGFDTERLRAALSYDVTLSQARNADSFQGAFELGLGYIFNIYKKPEVVPTILCPDL